MFRSFRSTSTGKAALDARISFLMPVGPVRRRGYEIELGLVSKMNLLDERLSREVS